MSTGTHQNDSCPRCGKPMREYRHNGSIAFQCTDCGGRLIGRAPFFRAHAGPITRALGRSIARLSGQSGTPLNIRCPNCGRHFTQISPDDNRLNPIDYCKPCNLLWLDATEVEAFNRERLREVPQRLNPDLLPIEAEAVWKYQHGKDSDPSALPITPDSRISGFVDLLGVPRLIGGPQRRMSAIIWLLTGCCFLMTATFASLGLDASYIGTFPGAIDPVRLFLSFFLHGNLIHLLANAYFLLVFGILSEAEDGWQNVLGQLSTGAILAFLADTIFRHGSDIPSLGASGGIAALVTGFALRHLKDQLVWRLPLSFTRREFRLPVLVVAGLWVGIEILDTATGFDSLHQPTQIAGALGGIAWHLTLRRPSS